MHPTVCGLRPTAAVTVKGGGEPRYEFGYSMCHMYVRPFPRRLCPTSQLFCFVLPFVELYVYGLLTG